MPSKEVITRRNLPHWYMPGAAHFVTFRLAGTLPQVVLDRLHEERIQALRRFADKVPPQERQRINKQWFGKYDAELDRGGGAVYLRQPPVAAIARRSLYFLEGKRYRLLSYCIMPNHVHALFQPLEFVEQEAECDEDGEEVSDSCSPLSTIMHSLKSFTAHEINKLLGRSGTLWQSESYDRWVRDDDELERIIAYIANNPVKAGLASVLHEWYFCSAHDRFLHDGSDQTWLDLPS